MANNNTNQKTRAYFFKPLIQKFFVYMALTGAFLQYQNCSGMTESFEYAEPSSSAKPVETPVENPHRKTFTKILTTKKEQLDMLLVIDNSGSMRPKSTQLAERLEGFVNLLENSSIDWQMCLTTTDSNDNGQHISWVGGNSGYILKKSSGRLNKIFIDTIASLFSSSYGRSSVEKGIRAMNFSVKDKSSNCYRDKAALSVIVISDEDEASFGISSRFYDKKINSPESFIQTVRNNFSPGKRLSVNSIVVVPGGLIKEGTWEKVGKEYIRLSNLTGGSVQDIGLNDYTIALDDIYKKIYQSLNGYTLSCAPKGKPKVTVDDRDYSRYVTVVDNRIIFDTAVTGPATIRGTYYCGG